MDYAKQSELVQQLEKDFQAAKKKAADLDCQLEDERKKLQEICEHDYIIEDSGDYHSRSYYYICEKCKYLTLMKPTKYRKIA